MINLSIKILFFYLLLYISILSQESKEQDVHFSPERIKKHLNLLGSDLFEGRGTGSTGGELAAKYLASEFAELNLIPMGSNKTYYQYIPMHGSTPKKESELKIFDESNSERSLTLNKEYILLNVGDQTFTPNPLQLVFCGYGIIAPEFDYNDYQSVNVEGKIVVVLEGEPQSNDKNYFEGEAQTVYSSVEAKKRLAISRGASGIIIIPTLFADPNFSWDAVINAYSFEAVSLAYAVTSNLSILFNPEYSDQLFMNSPFDFDDVLQMHYDNRMLSFPLKTKMNFKGEFYRRDFVASNIIGMIEGSDDELKDSYVLVTAHYDHLGIGPVVDGDSVYNGVLDNAIGVSALLEIASEISNIKTKPKRSILFALLTGEEKGLLGSKYYVDHPSVPLYKTTANINIDGIAVFDKFKSVVGIGNKYSTLSDFLSETAKKHNISVSEIPNIFRTTEAYRNSDQITFALAGVPSILIYEGLDYENLSRDEGINKFIEYNDKYYHTPKDDLNIPINYDAVIQHTEIIFDFILNIANTVKAPEWNEDSPYINARLRSIAEKR